MKTFNKPDNRKFAYKNIFLFFATSLFLFLGLTDIHAAAPTTQAKTITFSSTQSNQTTVTWTRGNGVDCAVFIIQATTGNAAPVNNTTYTAGSVFGNGTQIGATGWYCIYNGVGTSVTVTGLNPVTTYRVMVCEYNGAAGAQTYLTSTASGNPANVATTKANQTISFGALSSVVYGASPLTMTATASSGLTVTYTSSPSGYVSISGSTVTILKAGTVNIIANQTGNSTYNAATRDTQALTITPAPLTATANNLSKVYNTANPTLTITYSGFVYSDTKSSITQPSISTTAVTTSPVGTYPITLTGGSSANYSITLVPGILTVTPASQTITFNALASKVYGSSAFNLTATASSGLAVTYSSSNSGVATVSGATVTIVGAGTTTITASQAGNSNYAAAANVTQNLVITPAALKATAVNHTKVYNTANPTLTISYTGFVYADDTSSITQPTISTTAVTTSPVGTYPITLTGGAASNYTITLVNGTLTVTKASQVITFGALSPVVYGASPLTMTATASSGLTVTYTSSPAGYVTISGSTVTIVKAGTVNIIAAQSGNSNYNAATRDTQALTITPVPLTATANNLSKVYNTANPTLTITYSGFVYSDTKSSITQPSISTTAVTTSPVGAYPITLSGGSSSNYIITLVNGTLTVTQATQNISFTLSSPKTFSLTPLTLTATGGASGNPVTYTSSDTLVATVSGNILTYIGVGTTIITASQAGNNNYSAATDVSKTLVVNIASQTITFPSIPAQMMGNADLNPGATASSGLAVTYTSSNTNVATIVNNLIHIVGIGTSTITASQGGSANFSAASNKNQTLTVNKGSQTITFPALPTVSFNSPDFAPGATASSLLPVSYTTSNPAIATIVNGLIHITGVGTVNIIASQAGNNNFNAAPNVTQPLVVTIASQTLVFGVLPNKIYGDADFDPGAVASSGLTISYSSDNSSVATIVSGKVHITGAGTAHITASQPGNANYSAAVSITQPLIVNKSTDTISFLTLTGKLYWDADFNPGAVASSGLPITYLSDNTNVATIVNGLVHIVAPGTVNITATQPGNINYLAAPNVTHVLTVYQDTQSITFGVLPVMTYGDPDYSLNASSTSGLSVTFSSDNPAIATIVSGKVHIIQPGTVHITARQAGNSYYAPDSVIQLLTIIKENQALTFGALPAKIYGDSAFNPGAISNRGLAISYTSDNPLVAVIYNGMIQIVGTGSANITASQPGNSYYNAAASITQPLTVSKASQTITFGALPAKVYGDPDFNPGATSSSSLTISYSSNDTAVATIVGGMIHILSAGSANITATQNGNGNYYAAVSITQTLTVAKVSQTITFAPLPAKYYGDTDFNPGAFASTGLTIIYSSDNPNVATIVNGMIHIVGVGTAHITASQSGDANHNPASVTQILTVNKALQVITFNTLPVKTYGNTDFSPGATSTSGLSVTYTSDNLTVATIVNGKIHIVGAGTANITANQAGNAIYAAALPVTNQLTVLKASQSITFNALPSVTYGVSDFYPTAAATSGLPVSFASDDADVATIVNGKIHVTGAGTADIIASQPGNDDFGAAPTVSQTLVVNKAGQTIIFGTLPVKTFGAADFSPGAISTAGLAITYSSDNTNVATIVNDTIHITGTGSAHITAMQSGNGNYNAAVSVVQLLIVDKALQTITFNAIPSKTYGDNDFDPGAVSSSGLPVGYTSGNDAIATIIDGKVHIVGVGTVLITASQPGNTNFIAATADPSQLLVINKAVLTITADSASRKYGEPNPVFTYWCTGFMYDDDITSLAVQPVVTTSATISSLPGEYDLIPQGGSDPNYSFVYQKGILTIVSNEPSIPGKPSGATYVCVNSSTQTYITSGSSNATTYVWALSPSNAGTISGNGTTVNITFNSSFHGNCAISVSGQNPSGVGKSSDTLNVDVLPLPDSPDISMKGAYCSNQEGDSIMILNSQTGYIYQLDLEGSIVDSPLNGNGSSIGWYGLKAGTYDIMENVCNVSVASNLVIKEVANSSSKPQLALKWDDVVICESSNDSITSYEWFKNDSLIAGQNLQYLWTQKKEGYYSVVTIDSNGCSSTMSDNIFVQASLGTVYPNPAHGQVNISFTNFEDGSVLIKIYNANSLPMKSLSYTKIGQSFAQTIDISDLNTGVYYIEILLNGKRIIFEGLMVQ